MGHRKYFVRRAFIIDCHNRKHLKLEAFAFLDSLAMTNFHCLALRYKPENQKSDEQYAYENTDENPAP